MLSLQAQTDSLLLRDFDYIKQSTPWLTQPNAAALALFPYENISHAELSAGYSEGRLTPSDGAPRQTVMNGSVESFFRMSSRAVVYGLLDYGNRSGRGMTGSVFLPSTLLRPFDIVEDSLTNAGSKHSDTYRLAGAFSYRLTDALAVGARADYTSANYAKYKDLRHSNKFMNLEVTAGILSPLLSWLTVGADYTYRRQTESITFDTFGKNDKVYKSLIDYGASMGIVEQFGNGGYTDKTNEMPFFEDGHGGSLQVAWRPSASESALSLFHSISFSRSTGYYGRRSPYSITFTNHDRDVTELRTSITFTPAASAQSSSAQSASARCAARFVLDVAYTAERLHNRANTFRGLTNANGATHYEYYDDTETGSKSRRTLSADCSAHLGIRHELPTWTVTAGYRWQRLSTLAYLYPFFRRQLLTVNCLSAGVTRNVVLRNSVLSLTANGSWQNGYGSACDDGTLVAPDAAQPAPASMDVFLWRDYEYMTAGRYSVELQAEYSFIVPGSRMKAHVRTAVAHKKASVADNSPSDLNSHDRTAVSIAAGLTF